MSPPTLPPDPQLLSQVLRSASVGVWALNVSQGVVEWATDVDAYSGYSDSAGSMEEILARVHPDDRQGLIESIAQPFDDGETYEYRYRIVNPDGSTGHVLSRGRATIRPNGDVVMTGVSQDITALTETGQALARSEARAHFMMEASTDLVGRHDAGGRFVSVSPQADEMLGQAQSQLVDQSLGAWLHADDVEAVGSALAQAPFKAGTTITTVARRLPLQEGDAGRWLETRWRRLPSLDGAWVSTTRDVTEQRQAAAASERNQQRLRRLTQITAQAEAQADDLVGQTLTLLASTFDARAALVTTEVDGLLFVDASRGPHAPRPGHVLSSSGAWPRPTQASKVWYTSDAHQQNHPAAESGALAAIDLALRVDGEYRGCVSIWLGAPVDLSEADQHFLYLAALWLGGVIERSDAQDRLRASSDLLQSLLDTSLDGIMVFESVRDADGAIVDFEWLIANRQNEILIELSPDELIGKRMLEVLPGNRDAGLFDAYVRVVETSEPFQTMIRYAHDDLDFWIQIAAVQLGDGFFVTFRDVSEDQRSAERVRESEERYRLLAENSADFIALHDSAGLYRYVSPASHVVVGRSSDELVGADPFTFVHPDDLEQTRGQMRRAVDEGAEESVTYRYLHGDGHYVWVETVIGVRGVVDGDAILQTASRDVTERVKAERERARLYKTLSDRNKELQDFAYVASHDLQEPLRKIQAFSDLLVQEESERLSDDGRHFLDRVSTSASRMSDLINDLLAYSRIATQAHPFQRVDLTQVLGEVLVDLDYALEQVGAVVTQDPLPTLDAEPMQMRQLLHNLIGNAAKFRRDGVPLRLHVGCEQSDGMVALSIRDNGIGFDTKYVDRIFSPFQRLHGRDSYPGTGMGLAICRRIAQRHGGEIDAQSTPGEGTTFYVTLSLTPPTSEPE